MPELPEVETLKKYFDLTALNKRIASVEGIDSYLLKGGQDVQAFAGQLKGRVLTGSRRHGKYLFLETQGPKQLILHFGMTGYLEYIKKDNKIPHHTRLLLRFKDSSLAFVNTRRLGKIYLYDDIGLFLQEKRLGPDALKIKEDEFTERISRRKKPVKSALMDQHIISGIGNLYADEILFQSSVHPLSICIDLDKDAYNIMFQKTKYVLKTAIGKNAKISKYPDNWLLPHRMKGDFCPHCKGKMKTIKIGGRTAYFCPGLQKKYSLI